MRKFLYSLSLGVVLLISCSQQEFSVQDMDEIQLTSHIVGQTRGGNLEEQSTQIKAGQRVGVTIIGASAEHQNVAWVAEDDGVLWNTGDAVYYNGIATATITAYQPYCHEWEDASGTFRVQEDQSGDGYVDSDLLFAQQASAPVGEGVNLAFRHVLAKVNVLLEAEDVSLNLSQAQIIILNTVPVCSFSNGVATVAKEPVQEIKAGTGAQASAILIPQVLEGDMPLVKVLLDEKTYLYSLREAKEFQAGKVYTFRLTLREEETGGFCNEDFETIQGQW